jgi:hypothetical protein
MLWPLHSAEHGPLAIDDSSCNNLDSLHVVGEKEAEEAAEEAADEEAVA